MRVYIYTRPASFEIRLHVVEGYPSQDDGGLNLLSPSVSLAIDMLSCPYAFVFA